MLAEEIAPPAEEAPRARQAAKLVVSAGTANKSEIPLQKVRTNIGRLTDVYKAEGLSRRNDLAFAEDNPINRTVSREHAHIVHDKKTGEYRLFNDRWYKRGDKAGEQLRAVDRSRRHGAGGASRHARHAAASRGTRFTWARPW